MSFSNDILASARSAYSNRQEPERLQPLAQLYWRLMFAFTVLLVAGAIAWGVLQLMDSLALLGSAGSANTAAAPALNKAQLQSTISGFDARQAQFDALKKGGASAPDPSR